MEYRLYSFVNMYLSSIQKGIQTAHMAVEMTRKYRERHTNDVWKWAQTDKTIIVLEGGNCRSLMRTLELIQHDSRFAWAKFNEDRDSLNGALTCVGVVLPATVYEHTKDLAYTAYGHVDGYELKGDFYDTLRESKLAV